MKVTQIYTGFWLSLEKRVRDELVKMFSLRPSNHVEVVNNQVISDGFTDENLRSINIKSMQEVLGSKEKDFMKLLEKVLDKISPKITEKTEPKKVKKTKVK